MILLEADNRVLLGAQRYTFTQDNYPSGVSTLTVMNTEGFDDTTKFILVGNIGSESAEIFRIGAVDDTTRTITLHTAGGIATTTRFPHAESTRVTILPYNQIRFYYTLTDTYSDSDPLSAFIDLQPSEWFTTLEDENHSTGYGWFVFYNSAQTIASQPSNPIPYVGFGVDTVQTTLDDFFSMISNKDLKVIDRADALSWMNEGIALIRKKINLSNREYHASDEQTLSIVGGTSEYDLLTDFSKLIYLVNEGGEAIPWISLREAKEYAGSATCYYLRGKKIGFVPTPTESATYLYRYLPNSGRVSLNSDEIDLPDNGVYIVKDFMLYRAHSKLMNFQVAANYRMSFDNGMKELITSLVDRDAHLDSIGLADEANV